MATRRLVSVDNSWQGTVRHNPWSRDYAPVGGIVTSPFVTAGCGLPYGWLIRVDPQDTSVAGPNWPTADDSPPVPVTTFVSPMKGRIVATGACGNRISVYFDITSGSTTWLAPFRDVGVEVLAPIDVDAGPEDDPFPFTEVSGTIDGFVSNEIETGACNSLVWTDVMVNQNFPSVVRPYCKKITVFDLVAGASTVPLYFVDGYTSRIAVRVPTGTPVVIPGWVNVIQPTDEDEKVQIIQTIDPSGVAS